MMAVTAANAEIASVEYVGNTADLNTTVKDDFTGAINELVEKKQDKINNLDEIKSGAALGATSFQAANVAKADDQVDDDEKFVPTVARAQKMIDDSQTSLTGIIGDTEDFQEGDSVMGFVNKNAENIAKNTDAISKLNDTYVSEEEMTAFKGTNSQAITAAQTAADNAQAAADAAVKKEQVGIADDNFAISDECKAPGAVCSLVVRAGVAGWEKIRY